MGLDVSKITNAKLQRLAYEKDTNNDNNLNADEFRMFKEEASKLENISDNDFNQAMGLYVSNPNSEEAPAVADVEATEAKPEAKKLTRAEKKENKEMQNALSRNIASYAKMDGASLDYVKEQLEKAYDGDDYNEVLTSVTDLINKVQSTEFKTKEDVKAIKKAVNKGLNGFEKGILNDLVKIAEKEVISKEAIALVETYAGLVEAKGDEKINYENILEEITNSETYKNTSYKKEAMELVEKVIAGDVEYENLLTRQGLVNDGQHDMTTKKLVSDAIAATHSKDDKIAQKVSGSKSEKADDGIVARYEKKEKIKEEVLQSISKEDLRKALGGDLFQKLNASYLKECRNEDGSYDLREISDIISKYIGYDLLMNTSEAPEISEETHTIRGLNAKINPEKIPGNDIKPSELNKLMKLCGLEKAPRDRNFGRAALNSLIPGLAGALTGLNSPTLEYSKTTNIKLGVVSEEYVKEIIELLGKENVENVLVDEVTGAVTLNLSKRIVIDARLLTSLAGAAIGVLTGLVLNLAFGMDANEQACFSQTIEAFNDPENRDIHKFEEKLRESVGAKQADVIMELVKVLEAQGKDWYDEINKQLSLMGGPGSEANCLEGRGYQILSGATTKETPAEETPAKEAPVEETPVEEEPVAETPCEETYCAAIVSDETKIHNTTYGDTWEGLVKAYYPNLIQACNGKIYGKDGAIRALKRALSLNNDGTLNKETYKKLLEGGDLPKTIKLPSQINGVARFDGTVEKVKVSGNGKALIREVGPNTYKAIDGCEDGIAPAYGSSPEEAAANLARQTGKTYNDIIKE